MPPKKRPYVPKVKGCYECSQRRIHCDRGQPECQKCLSKGLKCSGLGIRHRFNKGVASRGKWAGRAMESIYQDEGRVFFEKQNPVKKAEEPAKEVQKILPPLQPSALPQRDEAVEADSGTDTDNSDVVEIVAGSSESGSSPTYEIFNVIDNSDDNFGQFDIDFPSDALACLSPSMNCFELFRPMSDHIPRWKRNMLLHFSDRIAYEMVAIDGPHNGYRSLILPMCEVDNLVMDAVVSVSAFHLCLTNSMGNFQFQTPFQNPFQQQHNLTHSDSGGLPDPNELYARVILGLQERKDLGQCDQLSKHSVLMTLLVLLTGVMVTGCNDFPMLFRMLESALDIAGGEDGLGAGELAEFLLPQIHKMRVYAAPLLSEEGGREVLSSPVHATQLFDCLETWSRQYPDRVTTVSFVKDIVQQARDIYLGQVQVRATLPPSSIPTESEIDASISRVQRFKETLEVLQTLPDNSRGDQVLVWATFVAASDCLLEEHKQFFEGVFMRHHARSGFGNLLRGLENLRKIWARSPGERWTSLLPQGRILVM